MGNITWEKLYVAQAPKLLGLCRRYVQDMVLAEDLMHDAFLTAMQKEVSYKAEGPIEAWLRKITVNTVLMHLRKEKCLLELAQQDVDISADEPDAPESDIEQMLAQGFDRFELIRALDNLSEHHRVVFNLYVMENYTHKQIAEILGISLGTSKSHLARARKKLQELLLKKTNDMRKKEHRAVFFLLPFFKKEMQHPLDNLYRKSFSGFELPPNGKMPSQLASNPQKTPSPSTTASAAVKVGLGVVLVAGVANFWWFNTPQKTVKTTQASAEAVYTSVVSLDSIKTTDTKPYQVAAMPLRPVPPNFNRAKHAPTRHLAAVERSNAPAAANTQPVVIRRQVVQKDTVFQQKQSGRQ